MSNTTPQKKNIFEKQKKSIFSKEVLIGIILVVCTYFILACTFGVFGKIIANGAPVLAQYGTHFLTRSPETLMVVEVAEAKNFVLPDDSFDVVKLYNPEVEFKNVREGQIEAKTERFKIPAGVHPIPDGWVAELESANNGVYINWESRDPDVDLVVEIAEDAILTFDSVNWEKFRTVIRDKMRVGRTELFSVSEPAHTLVVKGGTTRLSKEVILALDPTNLIYIVQGVPSDDDTASKLFDVEIPNQQTITVGDSIYNTVIGEDEGKLPTISTTSDVMKTERSRVTIAAGHYLLPLTSYFDLKDANPDIQFSVRQGKRAGVVMGEFPKAITLELPEALYVDFKRENPTLPIEHIETIATPMSITTFDLNEPTDLSMPNTERNDLSVFNPSLKVEKELTFSYSGGGVKGPLIGTALLVIVCIVVALFVGVSASVYLNEYSAKGKFLKTVRLAMLNLAGVPSIIFGLFGLMLFVIAAPRITNTPAVGDKLKIPLFPSFSEPSMRKLEAQQIFVANPEMSTTDAVIEAKTIGLAKIYSGWTYISFEGWGTSLLAGGLTLAVMILPVIITACEESLRAVPMGFREASLALGASKWQSIRTAVLPYAFPGILTASVLGITRVAGETAPIMFTAAVAAKSNSPFDLSGEPGIINATENFFLQSLQALPYHIYTVAGRIPQSEYTEPMQYGATLLFLIVVMILAALSVWLRIRARKKLNW